MSEINNIYPNEIELDDEMNIDDSEAEDSTTISEQSIMIKIDAFQKIYKSTKCVCKLKIIINGSTSFGIGFFCYIPSKEITVLLTNNHVINGKYLKNEKKIKYIKETNGKQQEKIINLETKRYMYTNKKLDVTVIEILDEDLIDDVIEIDEKYIKNKVFENEHVFNIQFPHGEMMNASFGKIIKANKNNYLFEYDAGTEAGSSGSPILSVDSSKLIGMHKGTKKGMDKNNKLNIGIYLDVIINNLPQYQFIRNKNTIKCIYYIKKEDINKDIQIYNNENNIEKDIISYNIYREDELKQKPIDGKYRFLKEGKYYIYYYFNDAVKDLSKMFSDCTSLTKIYINSFPYSKIEKIFKIFNGCSSLTEIKFSQSFNTENIQNMSNMFNYCMSLEEINLSSFKTENVSNMSGMFNYCKSLKELNISSFNTEKVEDMSYLFNGCQALKTINLSKFNTKSVETFSYMFSSCKSLEKLDLSNFNINNATQMTSMFSGCKFLKDINLSTFNTQNKVKINDMFLDCSSLKNIDKCKDKKILEEFERTKEK